MSATVEDAKRVSILLVDDNRDLAEMTAELLEQRGFTVDMAFNGMTGLHLAILNTYDVVILDVMLPGLDGLEVTRKLRNQARNPTPILLLTARDTLEDKLIGLEAGADDYLVKPFEISELKARLRALIRRRDRRSTSYEVMRVGDLTLDTKTLRLARAGRVLSVSPMGFKLLTILMRESPRLVSRKELEREIWGDLLPNSDTLRSHIYNLRNAIDRPFDPPLLHTSAATGYCLAPLRECDTGHSAVRRPEGRARRNPFAPRLPMCGQAVPHPVP